MINKLRICLLVAVLSFTVGVSSVHADPLTFSDAKTVTINGNNYTIVAGSTATSMVLDATTLTVTVPASSTFTLSSPNRYNLSNNSNIIQTCTNSANSATVTGPATVVFTPTGGNCFNTGGGALVTTPVVSSGGGGGSSSPTPVISVTPAAVTSSVIPGCNGTTGFSTATGQSCATNTAPATPATPMTPTTPAVTLNVTSVPVTYNLGTKTLKNGSQGNDVKELQKVLNKILKMNLQLDGKLGPKTIAVIKKWQKAHGLKADGLIGAKTKAKMKVEAEAN